MANTKTINLDDDAYQIWLKKFKGGQDFSAWIQSKLKEEQEKEDSPEVLRNSILELTAEIEKLNAKRALKQKRLELKIEEEHMNSKAAIEEQERLAKLESKTASEKIVQKIGYIIQYKLRIKLNDIETYRQVSQEIAEKFATIQDDTKDLNKFVEQEITNYVKVPLL